MTPGVPPRLPLGSQRLVVVTGKGGVGKTTVTAALAHAAAASGRRVLAVEVGRGPLGSLLGGIHLGAEPLRVRAGLAAASLEPEALLGDFVGGVLRFRVLARRLLESTSFQVLAAAAPGLGEFLVLHRLLGWVAARPMVTALPPRRFTARDAAALDRLEAASGPHPYLHAARFQLERRRQADAQLTALRRAVGAAPVRLPFLFGAPDAPAGLAVLANELARAAGLAA